MNDHDRRSWTAIKQWRIELLVVGALVTAINFGGWLIVGDDTAAIKKAAVANCTDLRTAVSVISERILETAELTQEERATSKELLPSITNEQLDSLEARAIGKALDDINKLTPDDTCEERFDGI